MIQNIPCWIRLSLKLKITGTWLQLDSLVQERRNSIANALELCLSCTNPLICAECISLRGTWFWMWMLYTMQSQQCSHCSCYSWPMRGDMGHLMWVLNLDGLVQERCNSSALALTHWPDLWFLSLISVLNVILCQDWPCYNKAILF